MVGCYGDDSSQPISAFGTWVSDGSLGVEHVPYSLNPPVSHSHCQSHGAVGVLVDMVHGEFI